ncbi:hypothetical protein K1719_019544 [Acacia pycnantha]|nr:hypothetical protein K1719_019544 [Acacia pycnantha]
MVRKEVKSSEALRLTYVKLKEEESHMEGMLVWDNNEEVKVGPLDEDILDMDVFNPTPHDPREKGSVQGKASYLLFMDETKSEKESQFWCLEKLGYDGLEFVPNVGRSGGLIIAWKMDQELRNFASTISNPWVVVGDFNDILSLNKRTGGADVNFSRIKSFQDRVQPCQLSNMGFNGPSFTC